ncbi:uncharacterized protein LOC119449702 [Dermacentor silvarum]|uniref:uncharacterized protein LOC119449702 n=1 Tax=Dermacentor silvarum TaxID=543639 RepID=UPI00189B7E65|nr:uncharacterized protein LOC119449702 [Dermacentor silvarum]
MEPPPSKRNDRPRIRNRRRRGNHGLTPDEVPHFSFARHSAESEAFGELPPSDTPVFSDDGGASASAQAARARYRTRAKRGTTLGRARPPFTGGPDRGGRRGGRTPQDVTPCRSARSTGHGSFDDAPSEPCPPESDRTVGGCHQENIPDDDPPKNDCDDRRMFAVGADGSSASKAVPFPTFAEITSAIMCRREEIGPTSEKSISLYIHDCYLHAVSSDVRATLGSFRLVPNRGLGRVVTTVNCDPASLRGAAVAFCDQENQYICYGEILKLDGKRVALLYDGLGVTDDNESHEFVLVNLNLDASCFINHLASLRSKSFDDLERVKSMLLGEACQPLESGHEVVQDQAAMQTALDLSLDSKLAGALDEDQVVAVRAAVASDRGVLIHAPSGTGDKELLRAAVQLTLTVDGLKSRGPVLVVGSGLTPMFKNEPDGLFCLDVEVDKAASAVEESASAILSKGKMNECLLRISKVLKDLNSLKCAILHQSQFQGITREFSTKRNEGRNCVERWLMHGVSRNDMLTAVSPADMNDYREDCQYAIKGSGVPTNSNRSVGFRYERAPQTSQGAEGVSDDVKAVYIWKTLKATRADEFHEEQTNIIQMERCQRWQLYKQWIVCLRRNILDKLEDAQREVLHCYLHCGKMLSENVSRSTSGTSVIVTSVTTAIAHGAVIDSMQPKALVVFRAHQVPSLLAGSLFCNSISKLVFIGDGVCSKGTLSSSLWSCAFSSQGFELHELSVQYFLSQPVCNLLAPFTKNVLQSGGSIEPVRGIAESVQFFDIPNKEEAVLMISRLCLHFQTHGYHARDVAIVTLSPSAAVAAQTLVEKLWQVGCEHAVMSVKTLGSTFCKILILLVGSGARGSDLAAALSRARCAVYGFGRLASADESCQNVFNTANESNRSASPALSLSCVRHPGTVVRIESGDDFVTKMQQTGGCMQLCGAKKRCSHVCLQMCHSGDHPDFCDQHCLKYICSRKHLCLNRCSERCTQRCMVDVTEKLPYCTHTATFPCYKWEAGYATVPGTATVSRCGPHQYKCKVPVTVNLKCGHAAQITCSENQSTATTSASAVGPLGNLPLSQYKCMVPVTVNLQCGHTAQIPCSENKSTVATGASALGTLGSLSLLQYKCQVPVSVDRECGHKLQISCFENRNQSTVVTNASAVGRLGQRVNLPPCRRSVLVTSSCGHTKSIQCCDKAGYRCDVSVTAVRPCGHSCYVSCGADRRVFPPCTVQVKVELDCGHSAHGSCNRTSSLKCTMFVKRTLSCGHTLDVVCSEPSPQCRVMVSRTLSCGHVAARPCCDSTSPCPWRCGYVLRCKHACRLPCGNHPHEDKCGDCKDKCSIS